MLPAVNLKPPFNITRFSHVVLEVNDVGCSRDFYVNVGGLVETEFADGVSYLRGLSEACHHSLVLTPAGGKPTCRRIGYRVFLEEDLDKAKIFFEEKGLPAEWVEVRNQGRTLLVSDPSGARIELCSSMSVHPRKFLDVHEHRGARAQGLDHCQIMVADPLGLSAFYGELGFRTSEYIAAGDTLIANFMYRKGVCLDLALVPGIGPQLHHFAYTVPEISDIFAVCDFASRYGYGDSVERGPGRHGPSGVLFVYLRDPDGHRVEFFNNHYTTIDAELEPIRWDAASLSTNVHWGMPAVSKWFFEASEFTGVPLENPEKMPNPMTLERYAEGLAKS
ncbi:3,4-dihydroxyphenylacetate 2,3-dioxygenase protein [Rhizobium etli bv. mimosae str. IE4771]|uniref:3,4-dihydroxyphenylacetate 2,3-dioxygenase protein n=1 Tax=Rhizobium etli bv. mimosae str. IE4771 TaxID=1432050 RepID=A0A060I0V9_RHIET|nr:VOC family protein [Rhizobium sp. IE4771]AIC27452.1 3,4-dihydroxyphenylacetate 2,3-dioxygenase protein [Rhizobium sp. IE4771]